MLMTASGRGVLATHDVAVPDVAVHVVDLELPAGVVAGTVLEAATGAPLADALAEIQVQAEDERPARVTTGPDGRFELFAEAGSRRLIVSLPGYSPVERDVVVREGTTAELKIALERGLELRGRVVDAAGNGVGGVSVAATDGTEARRAESRARTLGDGSFVLAGLKERSYALFAGSDAAGFAAHPGAAPGAHTELVLSLRPAATVAIRVVDAAGAPIEGASVRPDRIDGLWFGLWRSARTGADGLAELQVPGGRLDLVARHPDGREGVLTLDVAGGDSTLGELVLGEAPGGR
jgi:hypothetical protein